MPKEVHVFESGVARRPGTDVNVEPENVLNPRVEVGWSKANIDGPATVSVRLSADVSLVERDEAGREVTGQMLMDEDIRAIYGSRADLNRLIHMLRKARDSAYGKDA